MTGDRVKGRGIKLTNEYALALGEIYADIPKAVLAAVAVSALTRGGEDLDHAKALVAKEWAVLHANGLVAQSPGKSSLLAIGKEKMKTLREIPVGARFGFEDEPGMAYVVTHGTEDGKDRVDATCVSTSMRIAPSFIFSGSEEVVPL